MAATFVVEDGTGLTGANSYLSEAAADLYFENHVDNDADWTGVTSALKQDALRMATQYLDGIYGERWRGTRYTRAQALDWPRVDAFDDDRWQIGINGGGGYTVPTQVEEACAEMAVRHVIAQAESTPAKILPDVATPGMIVSERVKVGSIEEEIKYSGGKGLLKQYTVVARLLRGIIHSTTRVFRA